jgi:hypothetical protein
MNAVTRFVIATAVLASTLCVAASNDRSPKPLSGVYAISPNDPYPEPETPLDSHFWVNLKGDAAKDLYDAMKVAPRFDGCAAALQKKIGGMECTFDEPRNFYQCHFAIHIATQKIESVTC